MSQLYLSNTYIFKETIHHNINTQITFDELEDYIPNEYNNLIGYPGYIINFFNYSYNPTNNRIDGNKTRKAPENVIKWLKEHNLTFSKLRYLLTNRLNEKPCCKVCGKLLKKYEYRKTYYCSVACSRKDEENNEKRKQTNLEKYGVENPNQNKEIREKSKQTCLKKYGVEYSSQTDKVKEKIKQTCLKKYGGNAPACNKEIQEKMKSTNIEKYGCENAFASDIIKEKIKQTNLEKYGVEHPNQNKEIQEKRKQTNLEHYGVEYPFQLQEIQEKYKQTCMKKYGVDSPRKLKIIQDKAEKTRRQKYYDKFLLLLNKKNISLEMTKEEYINADIFKYKCLICNNIFETEKSNPQIIYCSNCSQKLYSLEEKELLKWIKSIYSGEVIENNRKLIFPYELDIYIPDKHLAIEFNGNYWHSIIKNTNEYYHQEKTLKCKEEGIRLIHIFEYEWINKQEICKSIIKSAIGLYDKKIYARKCIVKDISVNDYKDFLEENHLQGSINSSIRYGLYYNDELVSVIGFGKSRFKKDEMELHRFCSKIHYQIIGAFSKLIKHSNVINFITYVDLAHFSGDGYKSLGFQEMSITKPNYKWVKGYEFLNRFITQKYKLKELLKEKYDENLTESENMEMNGYTKIYDSGNIKFIYNKTA